MFSSIAKCCEAEKPEQPQRVITQQPVAQDFAPAPQAPQVPPPPAFQVQAPVQSPYLQPQPVLEEKPVPVDEVKETIVTVSDGYLAAKKGPPPSAGEVAPVAPAVEGGWGDSTNAPDITDAEPAAEPASDPTGGVPEEAAVPVDAAREFKKASLAFVLVFGGFFGFIGFLMKANADLTGAVCYADVKYRSCEVCGSGGLLLPLGGELEQGWAPGLRAVLYFIGLLWCFLGVAIVCDSFMAAIEEVTSKEKIVWVKVPDGHRHKCRIKYWNDTVANLTLMALGSSAPEILLSCIELIGNEFFSGELGPSTIVGSAAFNLLVITAVCVSALPPDETRKVAVVSVFYVTASCSVWAYIWLIVILAIISPDKVDAWEALATFLMFPLLVIVAFLGDKGYLDVFGGGESLTVHEQRATMEQQKLSTKYNKQVSMDTALRMLDAQMSGQKAVNMSRAQYRRNAMANMFGGAKKGEVVLGFKERGYPVLECVGDARLSVVCNVQPGCSVTVRYRTREDTAQAGSRFQHVEGTLQFGPQDMEKEIAVPIIDNSTGGSANEDFFVELYDMRHVVQPGMVEPGKLKLGTHPDARGGASARVIIVDDDDAGVLEFEVEEILIEPGQDSLSLKVLRRNGTCGEVGVKYETTDISAVQGSDYSRVAGTLIFAEGQEVAVISVPLRKSNDSAERKFRITLSDATGGAAFNPITDGGNMSAICEVMMGVPVVKAQGYDCKLATGLEEWKAQFPAAFYLGGDPAEQAKAGASDFMFHGLALIWKFLFAFVPPPCIAGGWACFGCALCMIGGVTAIIGDMASLLGCCLGLNDDITAITLVALGTSLPDTFASKTAACHDDTADNSIGNVTGSNSVNVFLGLGLPWTIGAFYWNGGITPEWLAKEYKGDTYGNLFATRFPDGGFLVPAGSLGFSVTIFVIVATVCLAMLQIRRRAYGGELGGPAGACKRDSLIMVCLWFVYIAASVWKSLGG
jgi:solute carrier family 8 (sodium/calcium exchanger)